MPFSPAFKAAAVRRVSGPHAESVVDVALELGVSSSSLYRWRQEANHAIAPPRAARASKRAVESDGAPVAHPEPRPVLTGISERSSAAQPNPGAAVSSPAQIAFPNMPPHSPTPPAAKKTDAKSKQRATGEWSLEDKLRILAAAADLRDAELGAFLRERGLHKATLVQWQAVVVKALGDAKTAGKSASSAAEDKKRIKALERELARKEKAIADLLVLQMLEKKYRGLWGDADASTPQR